MTNIRPKSTHTYTVVQLPIPASMYAYIKEKLLTNGYGHSVEDEHIDMHGIALVPEETHV